MKPPADPKLPSAPTVPQSLRFPPNFVWGVATAAPQIEGAAFDDGKGPSVWDAFARVPGKILDGSNLDLACDHYHRYAEDVALMASLGVKHYRLSVAWPRIYPAGDGASNPRGIDFYRRLIDALCEHNITPWVTLFHWDLPQALEARGGWRVRETVDAFADYADTVVKSLGGQVKNWITLNEIPCFTSLAYGWGDKAPGASESEAVINQTHHHALLCHGHAVRAVRAHGGPGARVGLTDNSMIPIPVTETSADIEAARATFIQENLRILDPIYRGCYAEDYLRSAGAAAPVVAEQDFALITQPTDFLGLNVYSGTFVRADARGRPEKIALPPGYPRGASQWLAQTPQALYWGPRFAQEVYAVGDIYITENGVSYADTVSPQGEFLDLDRREFLRSYLVELRRAVADGVAVKGYFLWSFMDNFEWQDGYSKRFGIVHNDFTSQHRTPKLSAYWYCRVMAENRVL